MKLLLLATLLATSFGIAGCDDDSNEGGRDAADPGNGDAVFSLNGLAGTTYRTACLPGDKANRSERDEVVFSADSFQKIWVSFDGKDCADSEKRTTYVYALGNVKKEIAPDLAGWETYVYRYVSSQAQTHTVLVTETFNAQKAYGYDDWAVGVPKDIAGLRYDSKSDPKAAIGTVRSATVKIEGDQLSLARYEGNTAKSDGAMVYTKVP